MHRIDLSGQGKRVKIYALSTCPSCKRAKDMLDRHNIKYEYITVDTLESGEQWLMRKEIKRYNPAETYPTIVIEEVIIGFDEAALKSALNID